MTEHGPDVKHVEVAGPQADDFQPKLKAVPMLVTGVAGVIDASWK